MRIESISIHGFGCLVERRYDFPADRATLIIEDNESGKSTLASAIIAALCGFPKRRQAGESLKSRDVFKPWDSDKYSIEMNVEAGGRRLRIERDFARDKFVVRDRDTNKDISAEFDSDLAQQFFGLPAEDFRRTAFISGKEAHTFSSSKNIQARLSALVDGSQEDSSADIAIAALESTGYTLDVKPIKLETAISRLTKSIEEKKRRINELDAAIDAAGEEAAHLDDAKGEQDRLTAFLSDLDSEYIASRLIEVRGHIQSASINSDGVSALKKELGELEPYAGFPAERSTQLANAVTRLKDRQIQLSELKTRLESLQNEAEEIRSRLGTTKQFASMDAEDLTAIGVLKDALKSAQEAVARKREEIELEKRMLMAEGVDLNCALEARTKFQSITEPQREFLRSYNESDLQFAADQGRSESAAAETKVQLQTMMQKTAQQRFTGYGLFGVGLICGIAPLVLLVLHKLQPTAAIIATFIGILFASIGVICLIRSYSASAEAKVRLTKEFEDALANTEEIALAREDQRKSLKSITELLRFPDSQTTINAFRDCERTIGRSQSITSLQAQMEQAEESLRSTTERALRHISNLGITCDSSDLLSTLDHTADRLSKYISERDKLSEIDRNISTQISDISTRQEAIEEEKKVISTILADAGIDETLELEGALAKFNESETHHRRYRQINEALLPEAQKHLLPEVTLTKLRADEAELSAQINDVAYNKAARSSSKIEMDRQSARKEHSAAVDQIRKLEKSVGACVDLYRREYPLLQQELVKFEEELEKVTRFGNALQIARDVMKNVSENTHRRWAAALNEQAAAILPYLNPDYDNLYFDDSLNFTIRHKSDARIIEKTNVDSNLSTGAKDQIYLAVRLACCAELSRLGENIPIILDDPFMAGDDMRFRMGLQYLAENLAKNNQVIILSCHRDRHIKLMQEKWFSDNVTIVDL